MSRDCRAPAGSLGRSRDPHRPVEAPSHDAQWEESSHLIPSCGFSTEGKAALRALNYPVKLVSQGFHLGQVTADEWRRRMDCAICM